MSKNHDNSSAVLRNEMAVRGGKYRGGFTFFHTLLYI